MTKSTPNEREPPTQPVRGVHPAALVFPEMSPAVLQELAEDIKQNGLAHPIVRTSDGVVLDGINRLKACELAGVEPRFEVYAGGNPVAFIVSSNLKCRQLNESQRALIAARLAALAPGQHQAASQRSVQSARVVLDHGDPELIKAVEQGRLPVSAAARTAKPPKPRTASAPTRTKATIDVRPIRLAFRRVEKSAASGNANKLRKWLGELQRAVEEALK